MTWHGFILGGRPRALGSAPWQLIVLAGGVALIGLMTIRTGRGDRLKAVFEYSTLKLSDGTAENQLEFGLGGPEAIAGRVMEFSGQTVKGDGGAVGGRLVYLTDDEYQTVVQEYWEKRRCAAGFLNSRVKMLMLVADGSTLINSVSSLRMRRGDAFALDGRSVYFIQGSWNGTPVVLPLGNYRLFMPTQVSVDDQIYVGGPIED